MGAVGAGRADDERNRLAEARHDEADRREADADHRERQSDARERVLERWEQEIAARAKDLGLLDELDDGDRARARVRREHERQQRRNDAEVRRDAGIERDIRWNQLIDRGADLPSPGEPAHVDPATPLAQLATVMQTNPPLERALEHILAAAVDAIPECDAATVTLFSEGRLQTAISTATWAADLDIAQLGLGFGPLPSAANGATVVTSDLTGDGRWPGLADLPEVARSVMSVGLVVDATGVGVLTLYGASGSRFGDQAMRVGDLLAALAAAALTHAAQRLNYEAQAEAWEHGLASRDVIGQAKGILMEQRSVTADEAFNVLRETSQRLNVKVRVIAEEVVTGRLLPDG